MISTSSIYKKRERERDKEQIEKAKEREIKNR
jgi:hypothetical protein